MPGIAAGPGIIVLRPDEFATTAARLLAETIVEAVRARGRCAIALSGGTTPGPVYRALGAAPIADLVPWDCVDIYFADERAVPPDDPESNFRMVLDTLLDDLPITPSQVRRMEVERQSLAAAADAYERVLPERALISLILGMGSDGHTASLFPRSVAVLEKVRTVVPATSSRPPVHRLTITPPVIAAARIVVMLVTGESKAATVARVLDRPYDPSAFPAQLAQDGTWILDRAAASMLPRKGD